MRKLVFVMLVLAAAGCSKSKGKYEKACNHMLDLAFQDIDDSIAKTSKLDDSMASSLKDMKKQAEGKRDSDLATCVAKSQEHDIDADCILKADKLDDLQSCGLVF
jgi:hypothetical protein